MNKKGFTLMELLAVIIVLSIITLIAIPMMGDIIKGTREQGVKLSVNEYFKVVNKKIIEENMNSNFDPETCIIQQDSRIDCEGKMVRLELSGTIPESGILELENFEVKNATLKIDGVTYIYDEVRNLTKVENEIPNILIDEIVKTKISSEIKYSIQNEIEIREISCLYGTSNNYDNVGIISTDNNGSICAFNNLEPSTTYNYKLVVTDIMGNKKEYIDSFKTYAKVVIPTTSETATYRTDEGNTNTTLGNIPEGKYELGDEYIINVDLEGNMSYHFYIVSTVKNDENDIEYVNLIIDNNVCIDGTLATKENNCIYMWYKTLNNNKYGPVTAMQKLEQATSSWTNIPALTINFDDTMYGEVKTEGTTTIITDFEGNETARFENLNSRLPYSSEMSNFTVKPYLYNHLAPHTNGIIVGTTTIEGMTGYWSISTRGNGYDTRVWFTGNNGYYGGTNSYTSPQSKLGLRPVITLPVSYFSE